MIAAPPGIGERAPALLLQAIGLAHGGVEIDREGGGTRTGTGGPGPREEFPAHRIELPDVPPAEAAQERAERGGRLDREPEDTARATCPQGVGVIDAVATRERREDERQQLVPDVRMPHRSPEVEGALRQLLESEMLGQGGREQQPRIRQCQVNPKTTQDR